VDKNQVSEMRSVIKELVDGRRVYNDRLTSGARSIKVTGWSADDYTVAQQVLTAAGYTVTSVKTRLLFNDARGIFTKGNNIRLHVDIDNQ